MLVFEKQKVVIYTPPRCGSSTMLHYGVTIGNAIHVSGPDRQGLVWGHYARSFDEFKDFKQVVIIRRPLERLCSLFRLHRKHESTIEFGEYIERLSSGKYESEPIHDNQDTFLRGIKEDHIIYVDDGIDTELRKLGVMPAGFRLDRKNCSPLRDNPNAAGIGPKHLESMRHWWEPDCKRFNVEMR